MFRKKYREIPELNTTSTADISFMLLVFFLVTSSMNTDKGLGRKLSPVDEQRQEQRDINRSNVLQIRIDADDRLFCDDQPVTADGLQQQVESFVASRQTDQYVIAVQTDRQTSYDAYFQMQDAVVAAYHRLRDKMAQQKYGHPFALCTQAEHDAIVRRYPQRISEGIAVDNGRAAGRGTAADHGSQKGGGR